ncbi:MAG TPA: hypothetical protein VM241_04145 [Candidatus Thermoplasmatota archaeon]|nr:hypothetical protein [Candidatus Thermoplasmatota archaeon]
MQRNAITFGAIAVLLLGLPGLAAGIDPAGSHAATTLMDAPARQVFASLPEKNDQNITASLDEAAYFTALSLMGGTLASTTSRQVWEAVQGEATPQASFYQNLTAQWQVNRHLLEGVAAQLGNQTHDVDAREAERLLLAAHLLVQAEAQHSLAYGYLLGQTKKTTMDFDYQRYALVWPLMQVRVFGQAAAGVLAQPVASGGGSIDLLHLQANIDVNGGVGDQWLIPEGGALHRLARHVHRYQGGTGNGTQEEVQADSQRIDALYGSVQAKGYPGALLAVPQGDAQWWLTRPGDHSAPPWRLNLRTAHAALKGSEYEAHLLTASTADPAWPAWTWLVGLGGGGALVLGVFAWKRRSQSGTEEPTSRRRAAALLAVLLAAMAVPVVQAEPLPADPLQANVAFTAADTTSGFGNFAVAPDGLVHFVWDQCMGKVSNSCYQVLYRNYSPASKEWSATTVLHAGSQGSFDPRIYATGDGLSLVWTEGANFSSGQPIVLWWCHLVGTQCMESETLSDPTAQVLNAVAVVGKDGRLRIAWQEEFTDHASVRFREQRESGWGPVVSFPGDTVVQRNPAVAVDGGGRATVAWAEKPGKGMTGSYRVLKSAAVEPGASKASATKPLSHIDVVLSSRVALAALPNGTVAAAYTAPDLRDDVYVRQLPPGADAWTQPVNVSRDGGRGPHVEPSIQATSSGGLMVSWLSVAKGVFKVWKSELAKGDWLRPQLLASSGPGQRIFVPRTFQQADGILHLTWTGTSNGVSIDQMHYRMFPPQPTALPPTIGPPSPGDGGWSNLRRVPLSATVLSDAPLDMAGTALAVDGAAVPLSKSPEGVLSGAATLPEGAHRALLTVRDQAGNVVTRNWTFGVDLTVPTFTSSIVGPDGANATGWGRSPLHLRAQLLQTGGAPTRLQVSFGDDGNWRDLTAAGVRTMGLTMDSSGLLLPSGYLLQMRVRAIDDAGNVLVGRPVSAGWDERTQQVEATMPAWSTDTLTVALHAKVAPSNALSLVGPGPPINVRASLSQAGQPNPLQSATAVLVPGGQENRTVVFSGLATGRYTVSLEGTDDAGNAVAFTPATLETQVDVSPPSAEYANGVLSLQDGGSGVASISLTSGATVVQTSEADGAASHPVAVQWPAGTSVLSLHVKDRAGNTLEKILDRKDGLLSVDPSADGVIASSPRGIPALPLVAVVALLAAVALRRR